MKRKANSNLKDCFNEINLIERVERKAMHSRENMGFSGERKWGMNFSFLSFSLNYTFFIFHI